MKKTTTPGHLIVCLSILLAGCTSTKNNTVTSEPYTWKNVQVVGGGFVDGFLFHPMEKDLMYARTDMGGAYRRDAQSKKWVPLNDWVPYDDLNLMGIESMAIDPLDPEKLYLASGTYSDTKENMPNGEMLISNDRGKTFTRIPMAFRMGGNENGRGHGERLMVDPNNTQTLYMGTRHDGLWKSTDGAINWKRLSSFPDVTQEIPDSVKNNPDGMGFWKWAYRSPGINMVRIEPASKTETGSSTIYAFAGLMHRDNFFVSKDAGETWKAVKGQPKTYMPTDAELDSKGNMYITYGDAAGPWRMFGGAVMKYNTHTGEWKDVSPEHPDPKNGLTLGYASLDIDPQNENKIVVCSFHRSKGDEIFISDDGGETWQKTMAGLSEFDYSKAPYIALTGIHWLFDIEIDPFNSDHAIFTCGYGGHETFNFTQAEKGKKITWEVCSEGIEETVPLELLSPPVGPPLITAIGDYGGFIHWDLDKPAPEGNFTNPHFGNTDGIACAESDPNLVVRVGVASHQRPWEENIGYSVDMGKTWQPTESFPFPEARHGHIAVSSNGLTWIWIPENSIPYYTKDWGKSWHKTEGIPENIKIVSDKVNPERFYGVNIKDGMYYESTNGGITFKSIPTGIKAEGYESNGQRGDNRGGQDRIYATPGIENELWIASFDGLYYKGSKSEKFEKQSQVEEIHAFGFGKEAPGVDYPAIYLVGIINNQRGIFRSTDKAATWVRINDDQHQWGLILHITGDPKEYGRVYVGTHGRGTFYGDPKTE